MSDHFSETTQRIFGVSEAELREKLKQAGIPIPPIEPRKPGPLPPLNTQPLVGKAGKPENETILFSRKRLDVEIVPTCTANVRCDVGGVIDGTVKPKRKGGSIEWRPLRRNRYALRIAVWTELAFDVTQAINAAIFRHEDRKAED